MRTLPERDYGRAVGGRRRGTRLALCQQPWSGHQRLFCRSRCLRALGRSQFRLPGRKTRGMAQQEWQWVRHQQFSWRHSLRASLRPLLHSNLIRRAALAAVELQEKVFHHDYLPAPVDRRLQPHDLAHLRALGRPTASLSTGRSICFRPRSSIPDSVVAPAGRSFPPLPPSVI